MASAILDNMYNYYLTTYGKSTVSRYDSHKKSELRSVYNNIVKINKESPLYKIKDSADAQKFAIDIKEHARDLKNVIASLSTGDSLAEAFQKKIAVSDQDDIVDADYVGNGDSGENTNSFQMEIKKLASPQLNYGNYLKEDQLAFKPGSYSFDLNTSSASYEFQFNVNPDDTNRSVQDKLAKLFNTANVGIHAEVKEDDSGHSALVLTSRQTGLKDDEDFLFQILPGTSNESIQAMDKLGINKVTDAASNSVFLLNGTEHSSYSNTFTINNAFEVHLKAVSPEGRPATLGFKANVDAVADNIQELVDSYNSMVDTANEYRESQPTSQKLLSDMSGVAQHFKNDFEAIGLIVNSDSTISVDRDLLADAVESDDAAESFHVLNRFKNALSAKANQASLNPMQYVDKVVVAYKNPGKNFATPYITSMYSGLMLDKYL